MNCTKLSVRRMVRPPQGQRGVAALTVVMILFFVMAMVAAYTNRNLIFEQRIATNSYRANRALEAVDAGVEWTLALLNGGRIGPNCEASVDPAASDFRRRYQVELPPNSDGAYNVIWGGADTTRVYPACVNREGVLSCICPSVGAAVPAFGGVGDGLGSAFRIEFLRPGSVEFRPGSIEFAARGCASVGEGDSACTSQRHGDLPTVDGLSGALTTVGLVRALPIPPIAALTAGSSVAATALRAINADPATGLAVHAGGTISDPSVDVVFAGPAGSSASARLPSDTGLSNLRAEADDGWFRKMFGMDPATYRRQPAVRLVPCADGCTSASLANVLLGYPRNPIWVDGDLNLDTAAALGSAAEPLMLIVNGQLTVSANVVITGFVHADSIVWAAAAAGGSVRGAMVAKDTFAAAGLAILDYDRPVLDTISLRYGSFVRAPGSWNLIFR